MSSARLHRSFIKTFEALEARRLFCMLHPGAPGSVDSLPTSASMTISAEADLTPSGAVAPVYSSRPSAAAKLYLDFDGVDFGSTLWAGRAPGVRPAYDTDNNPSIFNSTELANIQQIWARVAEKFSPFEVDVTTQNPGNYNTRQSAHVVISGDNAWYGGGGGVAYVGGFQYGGMVYNTGWVFPQNLSLSNKNIAEAIAHEAGHMFGLWHQSVYNANNTLSNEYNPGDSARAPIMGSSYYSARGLWWMGRSSQSGGPIQDDLSILTGGANGWGYRPDDHGGSLSAATLLTGSSAVGVIERNGDTDYFSFTTPAAQLNLSVAPAAFGGMLDATLELRNSSGALINSAATSSLGESLTVTVPAGSYYLVVKGAGGIGDLGQYTVTTNAVTPPANDAFATASPLVGSSISGISGSNIYATREAGEPNHAGNSGGHSVWWNWTAPASGSTNITTEGSNFDTLLAVYTGSAVSSLSHIASNDDYTGLTSRVQFTAVAGTTYRIALDGYSGATGTFMLNLQGPVGPIAWDGGGNGTSWTDPLNWSGNVVPGPSDDVVISVAGDPAIQLSSGQHVIRSLTCSENLTIAGGSLSMSQASTISGSLTLAGGSLDGAAGLLLTHSSNTWSGGTMSGAGSLTVASGANLLIAGSGARITTRPIHLNGSAALSAGAGSVLVLGSLTMGSFGVLDLADNTVVLNYGGASPVQTIESLLRSGFNGGAWDGAGIRCGTASPQTALGLAEAADLGSPAQFAGQPIDATTLLIRGTLKGDANLDRQVDVADLGIVSSNWQSSGRRWSQGDFDYDADVDVSDLGMLASNWQSSLPQSASPFSTRMLRVTAARLVDHVM
jgi:hypothetical protein